MGSTSRGPGEPQGSLQRSSSSTRHPLGSFGPGSSFSKPRGDLAKAPGEPPKKQLQHKTLVTRSGLWEAFARGLLSISSSEPHESPRRASGEKQLQNKTFIPRSGLWGDLARRPFTSIVLSTIDSRSTRSTNY